jgi:predicted ABC-type ATPase
MEQNRFSSNYKSKQKIHERYKKSLPLLLSAIKASDRAYIFDNFGTNMLWLVEITSGKTIAIKTEYLPLWSNDFVI